MGLNRSIIQAGDGLSLRFDPAEQGIQRVLDEGIVDLSHGEFRHKLALGADGYYYQQNPPYPVKLQLDGSDLDALFDRGLACHTRLAGVTPEQQLRAYQWFCLHTGPAETYGYGTILELGIEGLIEDIPGLAGLVQQLPNPLDYKDHPICSVWYWLGWCYSLGQDYTEGARIGKGFLTPAEDVELIHAGKIIIIQDKGVL